MNESTNNPTPKKSFWAKLFGGKDNNSATQPVAQPTPVPPTDPTSAQASEPFTTAPPASELTSSPSSAPEVTPAEAAPVSFDSASSADLGSLSVESSVVTEPVPVDPAPSSLPPNEPEVTLPPSDPMVTPVAPAQPTVDEPTPIIAPQNEIDSAGPQQNSALDSASSSRQAVPSFGMEGHPIQPNDSATPQEVVPPIEGVFSEDSHNSPSSTV